MGYLNCLHCQHKFDPPSTRRYCSTLCKNGVDKQMAKLRLADDRYHETIRSQPTFDLTDRQCLEIEALVASQDERSFSGRGFSIKDAHQEKDSANKNELHESWANKGADLDVWQLRRVDRARFGGIVVTDAMLAEMELVKMRIFLDQPLETLDFHLKTFAFEIDEMYDLYLNESDQPYDRDLLNAA